jgi:hypothetical protein
MADDTHYKTDPSKGDDEKKAASASWDLKEESAEPIGDLTQQKIDDDELFVNDIEHMHEDELDIANVNKVVGSTDDTTLRCFSIRAILVGVVS